MLIHRRWSRNTSLRSWKLRKLGNTIHSYRGREFQKRWEKAKRPEEIVGLACLRNNQASVAEIDGWGELTGVRLLWHQNTKGLLYPELDRKPLQSLSREDLICFQRTTIVAMW